MSAPNETHPGEVRPAIEVALLPQLIEASLVDRMAVVIDVLRATTTITEALANGAAQVIPCLEVEAARSLAKSMDPRPLLGGERGGEPIAGFDAGNSPLEYPSSFVSGRSLVFTTTNGTRAMLASVAAPEVVLAAFTNVGAVVGHIARHAKVTVVCAGTNGAVTLEDTLLAGAICERLNATHRLANDQAKVARRLWLPVQHSGKLSDSLRDSQGGQNLLKLGRQDDIDFAAIIDRHSVVPQLRDGVIQQREAARGMMMADNNLAEVDSPTIRTAMLEQALKAAQKEDWQTTLVALVQHWGAAPSPSPLAGDLIERVAELSEQGAMDPALEQLDPGEVDEIFDQHRPEDLNRVLAYLTQSTINAARVRTERLLAWPADPRIDRHFTALLRQMPYQSTGAKKFWKPVFQRLQEIKDVSQLPALRSLDVHFQEFVAVTMGTWLRDQATDVMSALRERGLSEEGHDRVDEPALRAIGQCLPQRRQRPPTSGDELLADVFADPAEDGPRLVYADWLLEHDDPRGEFIMLQFAKLQSGYSRKQAKRENELLSKHWKQWVGPLADALIQRKLQFERGFLAACVAKDNVLRVRETLGSPYWSTVRHFYGPPAIYHQQQLMKSLESLTIHWADSLKDFCAVEYPWSIRRLNCEAQGDGDADALVHSECLPHLVDLFLRDTHRKRSMRILNTPFADRLTHVTLTLQSSGKAGSWLRWLHDNHRKFACFRLDGTHHHYSEPMLASLSFVRGPDGRYTEVIVDVGGDDRRLVEAIESLPIKVVRRIEVVKSRRQSYCYDAILQATSRFRGHAEVVVPG